MTRTASRLGERRPRTQLPQRHAPSSTPVVPVWSLTVPDVLQSSRGPLNFFSKPDNAKPGSRDDTEGEINEKCEVDVKVRM